MTTRFPCLLGLLLVALASDAQAMGIRSFVALPLEQGGTVLRLLGERNQDQDSPGCLTIPARTGFSTT